MSDKDLLFFLAGCNGLTWWIVGLLLIVWLGRHL
jgi:hypothetical protein